MKVYIVTSDYWYDSNNFERAFSTREKAEAFIERVYGKNSSVVSECEEVELDEE